MKIKTRELTGTALDWAVGKADNRLIRHGLGGSLEVRGRTESGAELPSEWDIWMIWTPSVDWSQGGPLLESSRIRIDCPWNPGPYVATCKIDGTTGWSKAEQSWRRLCVPTSHQPLATKSKSQTSWVNSVNCARLTGHSTKRNKS